MKKTRLLIHSLLFSVSLSIQLVQAADYTNSIGMKFNNIPAGSFYMGSCKFSRAERKFNEERQFMGLSTKGPDCPSGEDEDNKADDDETPQHKVRITRGFQMGIYEVTLGQFKKFIADARREDLIGGLISSNSHGDNAAVNNVSWNNAQDFIFWLNRKEGGNRYRLPTEAEWEYAARAGTTTIYSWGNSNSQASPYAWYDKNAWNVHENYAHVVGGKKPNPWGLYDMHGNVWEWVQDLHDKNYYLNSPTDDPTGPSSGRDRVFRGGSWRYHIGFLRSADRNNRVPSEHHPSLGFRLLRQQEKKMIKKENTPGSGLSEKMGIWKGEAEQSGVSWTIKIEIKRGEQLIEYPSLNCGGVLTLLSETDAQKIFREKITFGHSQCLDNGFVELADQSSNEFVYRWYYPGENNEQGKLGGIGSVIRK